MAGYLQPIYTQTITASNVNAVVFNNIPQTYTDLIIDFSVRSNYSAASNTMFMTTQDGGPNSAYSQTYFFATGGTVGTGTNGTGGSEYGTQIFEVPAANATSNIFGSGRITIPNYTSTNYKQYIIDGAMENNTASTGIYTMMHSGLWNSNLPITKIQFYLQFGTTYFVPQTTFTVYGVSRVGSMPKALGGQVYCDGTYWYHAFKDTTSSSYFTPIQNLTADVLMIGGGGSGCTTSAYQAGGGGGAGGVVYAPSQSLSPYSQYYQVSVGAGGIAPIADGVTLAGTTGNNSSFGSLIAYGGGAGGGGDGGAGGSGGGGGSQPQGTAGGNNGAAVSGQGNIGGHGYWSGSYGGGGGGAGAAAANASSGVPTAGGAGTSTYSSWGLATGTGQNVSGTIYYAGGGGGGYQSTSATAGGNGGGGSGGAGGNATLATSGLANTGGGGGGAGSSGTTVYRGGNGGSGLVIVRYSV